MGPDYQQSLLGVFFSGVALIAVIAVPLIIIEWRAVRAWWRDITKPLP